MIVTPDEAKKLTCPFMRYVANEAGIINDGHSAIHYPANCCADACMAWRWQHSLTVDNPTRMPGHARQEIKKERGYCGAAGRV